MNSNNLSDIANYLVSLYTEKGGIVAQEFTIKGKKMVMSLCDEELFKGLEDILIIFGSPNKKVQDLLSNAVQEAKADKK